MPYGLSSSGFEPKPQSVIESEMQARFRQRISSTLNLGEKSLLGQFIFSAATQLTQIWEAFQAWYGSFDPSQATGDQLDNIGELRGIPRLPAAPSIAYMDFTLAAGTYSAGSLTVSKTGNSSIIFANPVDITTAGASFTNYAFVATENGPLSAPPGTLVTIANPIVGFTVPTNPASAVLGRDREEDDEYRLRQQEEQQVEGSTSADAIRADVLDPEKVPGVDYASVYVNDNDAADGTGLPGHSIEVVVDGTFDALVLATQIYNSKASGIRAYGTSSTNVTTSSGQTLAIGYTVATGVAVDMTVQVLYLQSAYTDGAAAEAAFEDAILEAFEAYQNVGYDVSPRRYAAALFALTGVLNALVEARRDADPFSEDDVVIGSRERATLIAGDIGTTATPAAAQP